VFSRSLFSAILSLCGIHLSLLHLVSADSIRGRRVEETYRSHSLPHSPGPDLHGRAQPWLSPVLYINTYVESPHGSASSVHRPMFSAALDPNSRINDTNIE
jgi:hypothetical protein